MADDTADDRVLALYRRYVGEPAREVDVYAGFALFFGGIALGILGLIVFLSSTTVPSDDALHWQLREVAIVLSAVGLPALLGSVVVLLPVSRRAIVAVGVGGAICLVAAGMFVWAYPGNWNVTHATDYSVQGIAVYAGGLAVLVAATGSALVAHHIERASPDVAGASASGGDADATGASGGSTDDGETVTSEQVERDIDEALSSTELSWGGVEKTRNTKRLKIETPDVDTSAAEAERAALDTASANTARSEGVDDAVAGLRGLQGEGPKEASSDAGVDEQTAALRELRERQQAEAEAEEGITNRLRRLLGSE